VESRLVRIPRHLLHVELDDLESLGLPPAAHAALRALLADLPGVPDATLSAHLIGPPDITLPCLAVLARHIGQGLRDHNLSLAHDRARLHAERRKLIFLTAETLQDAIASGDQRPTSEAVLFVVDATPGLEPLLAGRHAAGLASFVTSPTAVASVAHWRTVHLAAQTQRS
jgi:hypothetical protein